MRLDQLPQRQRAMIDTIAWETLDPGAARRLREMGFSTGVPIEVRHRSGWRGRGPLACQVGRMLVAIQHGHALAISVRLADPA